MDRRACDLIVLNFLSTLINPGFLLFSFLFFSFNAKERTILFLCQLSRFAMLLIGNRGQSFAQQVYLIRSVDIRDTNEFQLFEVEFNSAMSSFN